MKKTYIVLFFVAIIAIAGVYVFRFKKDTINENNQEKSPQNITYIIDGKSIPLVNGISEVEAAPGSASKIVTRYFGNEVHKDVNGDGREDVVFLLTQQTGGSGTFYYVVAALNTVGGYVGSQGLFLGDRIAPQTTISGEGKIVIINYADRAPGEDFSVQPSMGKSIYLLLDPKTLQFGEVVQNFEGEADPSRMTLGMKTWNWVSTSYTDGRKMTPKKINKFSITFLKDGRFSATTDCNGTGGMYTTKQNTLLFRDMMSTQMYCEGSQEVDFFSFLQGTYAYHFTSKGELILELKNKAGFATFN